MLLLGLGRMWGVSHRPEARCTPSTHHQRQCILYFNTQRCQLFPACLCSKGPKEPLMHHMDSCTCEIKDEQLCPSLLTNSVHHHTVR